MREKSHDFLKLGIPFKTQKLFLNDAETGILFFDKKAASLDIFLNTDSLEIAHLKVNTLRVLPIGKEKQFLSSWF